MTRPRAPARTGAETHPEISGSFHLSQTPGNATCQLWKCSVRMSARVLQNRSERFRFLAHARGDAFHHILGFDMAIPGIIRSKPEFPPPDIEGVAKLAIEPRLDGGLLLVVQPQPVQRVQNLYEAVERAGLRTSPSTYLSPMPVRISSPPALMTVCGFHV